MTDQSESRSLPTSWSRGHALYVAADRAGDERNIRVALGDDGARSVVGCPKTIEDLTQTLASVDLTKVSAQSLGILLGNWLLAGSDAGAWQHLIVGLPEAYLPAVGGIDVVALAETVKEGDVRGLVRIAAARTSAS